MRVLEGIFAAIGLVAVAWIIAGLVALWRGSVE